MSFTEQANKIFNRAINDYHLTDDVNTPIHNPYAKDTIEHSLYLKCWIDTVQWHYEDIIRDPHIDPAFKVEAVLYAIFGIRVLDRCIDIISEMIVVNSTLENQISLFCKCHGSCFIPQNYRKFFK